MTFRKFGARSVLYWCNTGHSSIVQVPRERKPWERVFCYEHRAWMYTDNNLLDEQPQEPLQRKD